MIKALILLSFSFFGNAETEGVFLNGYANGVVSFASNGVYEEVIVWDQMRLIYENSQNVNMSNFLGALFGQPMTPVFYTGVNISFWGPKKVIASIYFTGTMAGFK